MLDITVALDKLAQFESADEIAEFFIDAGVKAYACNAYSCAISMWVHQTTGEAVLTNNSSVGHYIMGEQGYEVFSSLLLHTPAMADFVSKFDSLCYPDLIEEGIINC